MKTKLLPLWIVLIALIGSGLILISSCEKEDPLNPPTLTTITVTEITGNTAQSGGIITDDGGASVISRGIVWGTSENPTINSKEGLTLDELGDGKFLSNLTGLSPSTIYYVRAYAINSSGTAYGDQEKFTTIELASVNTAGITDITHRTATSGGNVLDDGGAEVTARGVVWGTSENPTVDSHVGKTTDGLGTGTFISVLLELSRDRSYYVRAYAVNNAGTAYGEQRQFTTAPYGQFTDSRDGSVYNFVVIGEQEWMAENLRATKYNDGTAIPSPSNSSDWDSLTTGAYVWYENDETANKDDYGALYNWYAVNTGNLCPTGWHVPTDNEWTQLIDYLGGRNVAGVKLKSTRTAPDAHPRWNRPNTGATDEYGFSALPGGAYIFNGGFQFFGYGGLWWSSTEGSSTYAWGQGMYSHSRNVNRHDFNKKDGVSVRCVRDD